MTPHRHILYVTTLILATVGSGLLIGRAAGRWGASSSAVTSEQLLSRQLPEKTGNWRMLREQVLEPDVLKMMQCKAYISRVYQHVQTGDLVTVAVLVGPAGPISVHTPEICYSAHDFTISKTRIKTAVEDASGTRHEFWDVFLKSRKSEGSSQRVLYAWSTGGAWDATDRPRFTYAGAPYLYKIQLAAGSLRKASSGDFDPSQDFLRSFLTQCQSRLTRSVVPASDQ